VLKSTKRARSGPFHRTQRGPHRPSADRDQVNPSWTVINGNERRGRRVLFVGVVLFFIFTWLAMLGLVVWLLLDWD